MAMHDYKKQLIQLSGEHCICILADCYDDGMNYAGNELISVANILSPYFCLLECQKRSDCLFYTYNMDSLSCELKSSNGIPNPSTVSVSGSVVCQPRGMKENAMLGKLNLVC